MNKKQFIVIIFGFFICVIGLFWFFQGIAILHICPILCISNCECITSPSQFWQIAGIIVFIIGIMIISMGIKFAKFQH